MLIQIILLHGFDVCISIVRLNRYGIISENSIPTFPVIFIFESWNSFEIEQKL